jgi:hypothetical protein
MTSKIELLDQKRKRFRKGTVTWLFIFVAAWLVRSALKVQAVEAGIWDDILLAILVLSLIFQAYYVLREMLLGKELRNDSLVKEALNDELTQLNALKAWKAAFFAVIGYILIVSILSFFVHFNDLMLLLLTAFLIGFGTYNAAVYFLNR